MTNVLVFGDSLIWGAWDREGGWVQRLRKLFDEKHIADKEFFCLVYNSGISGNTTEHLLERFEFEAKQRLRELEEAEEAVIIIGIGLNDSAFLKSKNSNWVKPEDFEKNIRKLISVARKFSSKIVFIGLLPIDDSKTTPIWWNEDLYFKMEDVKQYNKVLRSVCDKDKIYFVEILEKFMKLDYKNLLFDDGLHLNSEGHKKIFSIIWDFLIRNKVIQI